MNTRCERCKSERECGFYGRPADVGRDKTQNGEWLCDECVPLRNDELGNAIEKMKAILNDRL